MDYIDHLPEFVIANTKEAVSRLAVEYFISEIEECIHKRGAACIAFPTGNSLSIFYELLANDYKKKVQWEKVFAFSLDAVIGVAPQHPKQFQTYMNAVLFSKVAIPEENVFFLDGSAADIKVAIKDFEARIKEKSGIDITLLGVGSDGHIAMNFPGSAFNSRIRKVSIPPWMSLKLNDDDAAHSIPLHALTVGIGTILSSRKIILMADGKSKQQALKELVMGEISEQWPVTALRRHSQVRMFVSDDAFLPECLAHICTDVSA